MSPDLGYGGKALYLVVPAIGILIASVYMLITGNMSPTIRNSVNENYLWVLLITLLSGSVVMLGSYLMKRDRFSLDIEFAGLITLALSTGVYGIIIVTYEVFRISAGGALTLAFSASCVVRMVDIQRKIRGAKKQEEIVRKHLQDARDIGTRADAARMIARSEHEGWPA